MNPGRSRPFGGLAPLILLAGFGLFWFSDTVVDPDLWGHVRFGQDILRAGSIIQVDPYSYRTAGQRWINHEWLAEVLFAGTYDASGPRGLIVAKVLVCLLIVGICYGHLRRRGLGPYASSFLLIVASIPFRMGMATVRPQVFSYLFFLVELLLIEGTMAGRGYGIHVGQAFQPDEMAHVGQAFQPDEMPRSQAGKPDVRDGPDADAAYRDRRLWSLPVVFAAWVNLHGGVLAGIAVLGLWIAVRAVQRIRVGSEPPTRRAAGVLHLGLIGATSLLALLLNPYGSTLITFLLRTATVPRPEISEWTPLGLASLPGLLFLGLLGVGILGLVGSRRRREPSAVLIFSVTALLPFVANRHYPLFVLALVVLVGEHIGDGQARVLSSRPWLDGPRRGLAAVAVIVALVLVGLAPPRFRCIRGEPFYFAFPARAVALLGRSGFRGNVAVPFDWGEYVIWHLGPAVKVSIDGRRETIYSDESYQQSRDLALGTRVWDALLEAPPATDLVLAPNGSPTVNLLARTAGWLALYQDRACAIFAREGLPGLDRIVRTPVPVLPDDGGGLCFPDPVPEDRRTARP